MCLVIDVYERLWLHNQDIAEETLKGPFMQQMQAGDLQADCYVQLMIQDCYFLVKITDMLKELTKMNMSGDIYELICERHKSYQKRKERTLKEFHLGGVSDIKPMSGMEKILSEFNTFATDIGAIFFVVALYSYERLMNWLAEQLNETQKNPYYFWKIENLFLDIKEHYKKLLDHHLKTNEQIQKAEQIFRQQMQNEQNFFASFPRKILK